MELLEPMEHSYHSEDAEPFDEPAEDSYDSETAESFDEPMDEPEDFSSAEAGWIKGLGRSKQKMKKLSTMPMPCSGQIYIILKRVMKKLSKQHSISMQAFEMLKEALEEEGGINIPRDIKGFDEERDASEYVGDDHVFIE